MSGDLLKPSRSFTLACALPLADAKARIEAAIDPNGGRWYLRARRARRLLAGKPTSEGWRLKRLVPYPDPWRPEIQLQLAPEPGGTRLEARLSWPRLGQIATVLWVTICLGVASLIAAVVLAEVILPRALVLAAFALIYVPFPWLDLWAETRATRALLAKILA